MQLMTELCLGHTSWLSCHLILVFRRIIYLIPNKTHIYAIDLTYLLLGMSDYFQKETGENLVVFVLF